MFSLNKRKHHARRASCSAKNTCHVSRLLHRQMAGDYCPGPLCLVSACLRAMCPLQQFAELKSEAVDYVTGTSNSGELPPPIVALLIDSSPEEPDLEALKAAVLQAIPTHYLHGWKTLGIRKASLESSRYQVLLSCCHCSGQGSCHPCRQLHCHKLGTQEISDVVQILAKISRRTRILLIAFGAAVSVFSLSKSAGVVSAETFPGHAIASAEVLPVLIGEAARRDCISPLHSCRGQAEASIKSLRY